MPQADLKRFFISIVLPSILAIGLYILSIFVAILPSFERNIINGKKEMISELTNSLRVGPRSAGSQPGPVAYGRGGTEPTVSDANVVLGYLPPTLLGGDMVLEVEAAKESVATIGAKIGLSAEDAAQGILDIANEVMLGALRITEAVPAAKKLFHEKTPTGSISRSGRPSGGPGAPARGETLDANDGT